MRFALINNERVEARFGLKGICSVCHEEVFAKCGNIRVHHWSHRTERKCDDRWESQSEWHRAWKNNYPLEWQERHHVDEETKELHIADILTGHNLVIEFQHSHINPRERESREDFYTNLVWIVNGHRLKHSYGRFEKGMRNHFVRVPNIFQVYDIEKCFPIEWLNSSVPVIFDFNGNDLNHDPSDIKHYLYCLLPERIGRYGILIKLTKMAFIKSTINGQWQDRINAYQKKILSEEEDKEKSRIVYSADTDFNEERNQYYKFLN
nr:competence protein CoiA family protein [Pedobacter kyonggii]